MSHFATRGLLGSPPQHLHALDAIRGVAALVVVCLHEYEGFAGLPHPFTGHLAVDLFFLLSGLVIASAYDRRLATNMSVLSFVQTRLIRLYPLYLVGFLIGLVKVLVQFKVGVNPPPTDGFVMGTLMEAFLLPTPMTIGWRYDTLFFLNPPAWSLFFELLVNILFALCHRWLSKGVLTALLIVCGAALVYVAEQQGSLVVGNFWHSIIWCAPRVLFPFLLGVWIHRHAPPLPALPNGLTWLLCGAVVALLWWHPLGYRQAYELALVMVIFPLIVACGAAIRTSSWTTTFSDLAGRLSYAIYIVHLPLCMLILAICRKVAPTWPEQAWSGPVTIVGVSLLCLLLDRFYDAPVREWLKQRVLHRSRVRSTCPA